MLKNVMLPGAYIYKLPGAYSAYRKKCRGVIR